MRRLVLAVLLVALTAPAAAPAAAPALGARLDDCETGPLVAQRSVGFQGSMPARAGSSVLAMRFDLEQRRAAAGAYRAVTGVPGFGRYERSTAGAAGFVYDKRVERLAPGSSYRVVVRFRWTDADGRVLRRTTRRSPSCRQPDLRPELSVVAVTGGAPTAGVTARYIVQVRNGGPTGVDGPVRVGVRVDGLALPSATVLGLDAGEVRAVALEGPACRPGGRVVAVADPDDEIDEPREGDNVLARACAA